MKLEDQVVSLELAKRLKELGVRQESAFYWGRITRGAPEAVGTHVLVPKEKRTDFFYKNAFSAFTVAELGEMLPKDIGLEFELSQEYGWTICAYDISGGSSFFISDEKEAEARAKMLIHLIERGVVNPREGEGER